MFAKIAVLGLGRVGQLAAELLAAAGFEVTGIDQRAIQGPPFPTRTADLADDAATLEAL
ncbi:MAG: L-lysine dehydrogenase, partial [Hyphomicrobiales bacterium]|nr:L-lysine dehydrogenase [Hyphomicrobiales bacterium]